MATGPLEWRYAGQAIFSDAVDDDGIVTWEESDYVITDMEYDPDEYFGVGTATRTDEYGRRWVLDYVDIDAALAMRKEYDQTVYDMFGTYEGGAVEGEGIEFNESAGEVHTGILTSWDTVSCSGADKYFDQVQNGAMTQATTVPMNDRQRKIVFFVAPETCTGTMVDDQWVLTASHCITNSSGSEHSYSTFTVCTMENLDENTTGGYEAACFGATDVRKNPNWSGDSDTTADDYGVVKLDGYPGVGWFALSTADDGYFDGFTDYLRGYPGHTRSCGSNAVTLDSLTTVDTYSGRQMYSADGEVQSTPTGYVKWDTSVALGVSGGPHFYCPNGTGCDDGHYLTGVQSVVDLSCTWDGDSYDSPPCAWGYVAGPKARDIRDWVITNTP